MPAGLTPEKEIARLKYLLTLKENFLIKLKKMIMTRCSCECKDHLIQHEERLEREARRPLRVEP